MQDGGAFFPLIVRDLLKYPTCIQYKLSDTSIQENTYHKIYWIITLGDWSITKPSSDALSRNVWTPLEDEIGLERAKDGDDADPFELGVSTAVWAVTGAGTGVCGGALCSAKSLDTYNRNPPS